MTLRKRFNRSMSEVRPDSYSFGDANQLDLRSAGRGDDSTDARSPMQIETINEVPSHSHHFLSLNQNRLTVYYFITQESHLPRKQSGDSGDSDQFPITVQDRFCDPTETTFRRPAYFAMRQETTSTESKDTLTPLDCASDDHTLVDEGGSVEFITDLNFDSARQRVLRSRRSSARRNSETCDLNRSQSSLNAAGLMMRRQRSLTQSEPDSEKDQCELALAFFYLHENLSNILNI